jgi:dsDNA-specific endonuclease/ATPase MutS2
MIRDRIRRLASRWSQATRTPEREPDFEDLSDADSCDPFPEIVRIEIKDTFDLHSIPPRDVKRVVEEYLHQAHQRGFRSVRIIHGKGVGVQRQIVHGILARTSFVEDWSKPPGEAGGWGATIVRLTIEDVARRP